ncbi:hypothetical protein TNCV_1299121 [Trichonephila clavipes]|nr:hypothetical protein TNCV_1299121 [Trichonephila clavipes]
MCFRLPWIPVTTARLETYNVYPDIGAYGARDGMCRDRRGRQRDKKIKRAESDRNGKRTKHQRMIIRYKGSERVGEKRLRFGGCCGRPSQR